MNNKEVAEAFANHEKAKTEHLYTDGKTIWSYGDHFPIGTWYGDKVLLNEDKYSMTTSHHQGRVRQALFAEGIPYEEVPTEVVKRASEGREAAVEAMLSEEKERG